MGSLTRATTRREVLAGLVGVGAALPLARRVAGQESTPGASPTASPPASPGASASGMQADGTWAFTDDKGVVISLPAAPERIVADVNAAAPLWDFGVRPVAVFGWNANETGDFGPAGGNIDESAVAITGNTSEPIQPEAVVAADPDLLITITWTPNDPTEYWSIDPALLPQVQPIAPLLALSATGSADVNTERFAELAGALGADLAAPEIVAAREAFAAAETEFAAAAAAAADLSMLFIYVDQDAELYIASPGDWADLTYYQDLGLNMVQPDAAPETFWEQLSMEQALKYPADVVFHSSRLGTLTAEEIAAHPTLGQHPAVQAGQIGGWNQDFIMSYQGMTLALQEIMAPLASARKIT